MMGVMKTCRAGRGAGVEMSETKAAQRSSAQFGHCDVVCTSIIMGSTLLAAGREAEGGKLEGATRE